MNKKVLAALLAAAMFLTPACGKEAEPVQEPEILTIDIYDAAAGRHGIQTGWFAKAVKDRFDIELNILAPQVAGDSLLQTRAGAGSLGDIVILEADMFRECVENGLVRDISDAVGGCGNLMDYREQIEAFNNALPDNNGKIFGIPAGMTNTSPTAWSGDTVDSCSMLRWDLYKEIGSPDLQNPDELLDALEAMQRAHPVNEAGESCYAFSLWRDWDHDGSRMGAANIVQLSAWYGEKVTDSVILKSDGTLTDLLDRDASYYKISKLLNRAYRRGLVDPESAGQDWNAAGDKIRAGRVYLLWLARQTELWNNPDRMNDGSAFAFVPVGGMRYYTDSDSYYGNGYVFGVGSKVEGAKYERVMEFLDWYAGPEGLVLEYNGIEGFNYGIGSDGRYVLLNETALINNERVPDEWGGGGYYDGSNALNQWIVSSVSTNPESGEPYDSRYWSSRREAALTGMKMEWTARFDAAEPVEYMRNNGMLSVSPRVNVTLPEDPADIALARSICGNILRDAAWKMICAPDDDAFEKLWDQMAADLNDNEYAELTEFDREKRKEKGNEKTGL